LKLGCKGGSSAATTDNFVGCHHGKARYGKRNRVAREITISVIDRKGPVVHAGPVLTKSELLDAVEALATSRAEIARVLTLAPARVTELYAGKRDLSFDEARKLIHHYHIGGERGPASVAEFASAQGIAMVEEVDLALGMGGGTTDDAPESMGLVPFKLDWLRGLHQGAIESLRVVRGRGDSMQPTIHDGDTVLIDLAQKRIDDQDRIWAVYWGDLGMIKRVRQTPRGSYMLLSDNPVVSPIEAVDGEMHVLGRVVWIGRRV